MTAATAANTGQGTQEPDLVINGYDRARTLEGSRTGLI
jgi:hypothetical protein